MLQPFAIAMQPFINEITMKEGVIRDCADRATMENIRSVYIYSNPLFDKVIANEGIECSESLIQMEGSLDEMRLEMKALVELKGMNFLKLLDKPPWPVTTQGP